MNKTIKAVIQVISIIFSVLFPVFGFFLLFGPDRAVGLNLLLIASISIAGLLISDSIKLQKH